MSECIREAVYDACMLQAKRIVVGKTGCVIGEVGITARRELQIMLKTKLHLYLKVAIK